MQPVRRILIIFTFLFSSIAYGQHQNTDTLIQQEYKGPLGSYLDLLTEQTDVRFSFKNKLLKKKKISISRTCSTLNRALEEIKLQCAIDHNKIGAKSITLYPIKGKFVIGTVLNSESSERIVGAVVQIAQTNTRAHSDKDGNFRLYCLTDSVEVIVYHPNYQLIKTDVSVVQNVQFLIRMQPISLLSEVRVLRIDSVRISMLAFDKVKPESKQIIAIGGESDAMAHIKLIPGVQNISFGQQGLTIRGGSPDQNLTLLDGIPVYNTYHLLGLFSIFNASSINSIKLHKNAFPAKYTNRLSSVIDVSLKNGNKRKTKLEADIGVLSSGIYVNGPIIKNKLSYAVSARRTYADLLTLPLQNAISPNSTSRLWSYDLLGKLHWQINENNDISVSGYNGGDQLDFRTDLSFDKIKVIEENTKGSLGWRNQVLGAKWNSILGSRVELHTDFSFSGYKLRFSDAYRLTEGDTTIFNSSAYNNGLQELRGGFDINIQWNSNNKLTVGVGALEYLFLPFERSYTSITSAISTDTSLVSRQLFSAERFAFAENKTYFKGGNVTYSLRLSSFTAGKKTYQRFQPKIHLVQNIKKRQQLRFSMSVSNQFVHLVPNNNLGLPVDIWLPVTENLKPMGVTQFSTKYILKKKDWEIESGAYGKFYTDILEHESGTQLLSEENWEENLKVGSGRSYGLEVAAKIKKEKWSGYCSYTYSRSERNVAEINANRVYFSKFDRPNTVNLFAEYRFNEHFKVISVWNYASGNPITVPISRYVTVVGDQEVIVEEYGDINNYRLPSTHHLDIAFVKEKQHKKFASTFTFGVYNVYNRLNPFMAFIGLDDNAEPQLKLRSYLPVLPTFKYSIKL